MLKRQEQASLAEALIRRSERPGQILAAPMQRISSASVAAAAGAGTGTQDFATRFRHGFTAIPVQLCSIES